MRCNSRMIIAQASGTEQLLRESRRPPTLGLAMGSVAPATWTSTRYSINPPLAAGSDENTLAVHPCVALSWPPSGVARWSPQPAPRSVASATPTTGAIPLPGEISSAISTFTTMCPRSHFFNILSRRCGQIPKFTKYSFKIQVQLSHRYTAVLRSTTGT
eukprot:SAG31_NODE_185_length_20953_cov_17.235398_2_plen_159_part_00